LQLNLHTTNNLITDRNKEEIDLGLSVYPSTALLPLVKSAAGKLTYSEWLHLQQSCNYVLDDDADAGIRIIDDSFEQEDDDNDDNDEDDIDDTNHYLNEYYKHADVNRSFLYSELY